MSRSRQASGRSDSGDLVRRGGTVRYQVVHTVVSFVEADEPEAAEQAARNTLTIRIDGVVVLEDAEVVEDTPAPVDGPAEA